MQNWYNIQNKSSKSIDISIDEEIGAFGVNAKAFIDEVKSSGKKKVNLTINSVGGSVFDAFAIHDFLKTNNLDVNIKIEGLAASAATVIALAGNSKPVMTENSFFMIHNPFLTMMSVEALEAEDLREKAKEFESMATFLDTMTNKIAKIYVDNTGLDIDVVKTMMNEETWLDAEASLENGFISEVVEGVKVAALANKDVLIKKGYNKVPANYNKLNNKSSKMEDLNPKEVSNLSSKISSLLNVFTKAEASAEAEVKASEESKILAKITEIENKVAAKEAETKEVLAKKDQEIEALKAELENKAASKEEVEASSDSVDIENAAAGNPFFKTLLAKAANRG